MKSEHHPFGTYFNQDPRVLILGSFPCFHGRDYGDGLYSGSNLRIEEYNKEGIGSCLKSGITRILFTGNFVQRHIFRIFGGISAETKVLPSTSTIF